MPVIVVASGGNQRPTLHALSQVDRALLFKDGDTDVPAIPSPEAYVPRQCALLSLETRGEPRSPALFLGVLPAAFDLRTWVKLWTLA